MDKWPIRLCHNILVSDKDSLLKVTGDIVDDKDSIETFFAEEKEKGMNHLLFFGIVLILKVGVDNVKRLLKKDIKKHSFNRCPRDRITPGICRQYSTLFNRSRPPDVCNKMVPIALTSNDSDDATDRVMSIGANEVNSERLPTTECVAPESIKASPASKVDTTPIPATLGH
ncbi:hypothetical protein O181_034427 [Austropuccinia psidii MF-1]|uniref:Uncharacterized protein n=1 Tax=Austropuccinia psidii MF-1 TaxID=1389203 RepID=A0A9Q3H828_9BASI|nr:hypothetical protein [Austropuccinia psidii MF-1]